ncbi:MAG TPA: alpha/beta hydrolase [Azonexus sp.]|nr:alpha/beta hydrolase [Azonexus sp.]
MAFPSRCFRVVLAALLMLGIGAPRPAIAKANPVRMGIVLMHGKGGAPTRLVADLAAALESRGWLVANLEMPWSGRRDYDVDVEAAEREVEAALNSLRQQGAQKLFVAGHSQGGIFALYFGGRHVLDGVIAIAPGGDVGNQLFREKLGDSVAAARQLVADGKGDEKARLADYEGAKGTYPVITTPAIYLTWFDPAGAMNQTLAVQHMKPQIPVLFVAPRNDYPGLLKVKQQMFGALPANPHTQLYEPDASHVGAPSASIQAIVDWATEVAVP